MLQSACRLNLEGIISKCARAPYQSGRTDTWLKAKCRGGQEVVIGGWSGSSRNLRSLLVGVYRGDHLVHTGRVGTGFNKNNSGGLLKKLVALSTDKSPVHRQRRAAPSQGCYLGQAEADRRDRIRRLDRRRHGAPSRLQGTCVRISRPKRFVPKRRCRRKSSKARQLRSSRCELRIAPSLKEQSSSAP